MAISLNSKIRKRVREMKGTVSTIQRTADRGDLVELERLLTGFAADSLATRALVAELIAERVAG